MIKRIVSRILLLCLLLPFMTAGAAFAAEAGFSVRGLTFSPIRGPEGNIEYLMFLCKAQDGAAIPDDEINALVSLSHEQLKNHYFRQFSPMH